MNESTTKFYDFFATLKLHKAINENVLTL